jgi:hypothetical protein
VGGVGGLRRAAAGAAGGSGEQAHRHDRGRIVAIRSSAERWRGPRGGPARFRRRGAPSGRPAERGAGGREGSGTDSPGVGRDKRPPGDASGRRMVAADSAGGLNRSSAERGRRAGAGSDGLPGQLRAQERSPGVHMAWSVPWRPVGAGCGPRSGLGPGRPEGRPLAAGRELVAGRRSRQGAGGAGTGVPWRPESGSWSRGLGAGLHGGIRVRVVGS